MNAHATSTRRVARSAIALLALGAACRGEPARAPAKDTTAAMADMPGMDMPGMTSVPNGGPDAGARLTPAQLRQFGVTFAVAEARELGAEVRAAGVVTVDERRVATVAPRFGGYVERLYVRTTGEWVRRGQPLAAIQSPDVLAAEEELLVARRLASGEGAVPGVAAPPADLVASARRRLLLLGVSDDEIDAVLRAGRASRTVTLRAPAPGIVLERRVTEGQAVAAGEALYTLADLATVWVEAELREADAAIARVGMRADVELPAYPGRPLAGTVAYVYPTVDAASRAVRARVVVSNADARLRPGMSATVRLADGARRALAVPSSAVVRTGDRAVVFVDAGDGRLVPHDVQLGASAGAYVEVLSGIAAGQRVVTSAQYLLESESNLADVMRSMIGQTDGTRR